MTVVLHPRPAPVAPRPWSFPSFERSQLGNGVELITCHVADRPVIEARLVVPAAGVRKEAPAERGIAHLLGRALNEGTEDRTGEDFADAIESLGAGFGVDTDWEALIPSLSVPVDRLGPGLELLVEAVTRPRLTDEEIQRLVRRTVAEYTSNRQFPGVGAHDAFASATFESASRMAHPGEGTPATLETLTSEAVRRFWQERFGPVGATLVIVGDLRGLALDTLLERTVGTWAPRGAQACGIAPTVEPSRSGGGAWVVDFPGSVQTELLMGHAGPPVPVDDRGRLRAANHYLGGYFGSRLNTVLREQKAITYGINGAVEHRGAAFVLRIGGAVQADATAEAVSDTLAEIEAITSGSIDEAVFRDAVDHVVRTGPISFRSTGAISGSLVRLVVERLPDDYFDSVRDQIRTVTAAEAAESFARYIRRGDLCVSAAGDAQRIGPALEGLGIGPVTVLRRG